MDVKVRDINEEAIQKIDRRCMELSERTGMKWSRNLYLKTLIENDFDRALLDYKQDQFDRLLEKFMVIQTHNTKILEEYLATTDQLIRLLSEPS